MPYAVAHPVAVIPLARLMGRRAVVSALVIGSVIPDAWYFIPGLDRAATHLPSGLLLFSLPAGLLAYLLFHAVLKEPLLQLLPGGLAARVRAYACRGLPAASFAAVAISVLLGALTHVVWDAFTHAGRLSRAYPELLAPELLRWLQHGSTLFGTAFLAWWIVRKLRTAAPVEGAVLSRARRTAILGALGAAAIASFVLAWIAFSGLELRWVVRAASVCAAAVAGAGVLAYSLAFRVLSR